MVNQIKNVFNSPFCEISMLVIICCMVATNVSMSYSGYWTDIAVGSSIIGVVVLFTLLVWASYKLIKRKEVKEMPVKTRIIVENISRILLLYWLYITGGIIIALIWGGFIIWDGVRSVKEAFINS